MAENAPAQPEGDTRSSGEDGFRRSHRSREHGYLRLRLPSALMPVLLLAPAAPGTAQEAWTQTSTAGAPSARAGHTAVWTGSKMIVWGGRDATGSVNTGGIYDPATDSWKATSTTNAPSAREAHTAVWTGSRMIVWGGFGYGQLNTGGVYDPATDSWTTTSTVKAPSARVEHTAVWTGSGMIVWGGYTDNEGPIAVAFASGGIYDPATDSWTGMALKGAPSARCAHTAVWSGSKMVVWGGTDLTRLLDTGGAYDPATNAWAPTSTTNAPSAHEYHTAVWTGSRMIVWGGYTRGATDTGGIYDPAADAWKTTSTADAPTGRVTHTVVWTGSKMIVWGGFDLSACLDTGGVYDPAADAWTATSTMNAPPGSRGHAAVWTGSRMIVWGGYSLSSRLRTGGLYSNPAVLPPPPPAADFFTLTPCRVVDTRNAAGPTGGPALEPGAIRSFPVASGTCGVPPTATAVSVNLTVVQPAAPGHLVLYAGDAASPPLTGNVSFSPGVTRANNAIARLAWDGGTVSVKNASAGSVHLVLDVNGYFQ
jgi:N-acetylneuraminic acid mutarotase